MRTCRRGPAPWSPPAKFKNSGETNGGGANNTLIAPSGAFISAYKDPTSGKAVVVAINNNSSATNVTVFLSGGQSLAAVTPYETSATDTLTAKTAVTVTNSVFTTSLDAQSVTTFVSN